MNDRFPIGAVAKITGISIDTLRAWERRYKAVVPERSDRGRQYGPAQIDRLSLLNQLVQRGHTISGIASLGDNELRSLLARRPSQAAPQPSNNLLDPVLSAVEDFDHVRAEDELTRLAAILAPRDVVYQIALPLMNEVGIRWSKGILGIAQEHLVSQMMRNLLGSMTRLFRSSGGTINMVLATPAEEFHEFGILAAAMLASMAGIQPVYLGPNLPAQDIANAADRTAAQVIVIGVTMPSATAEQNIRSIAAVIPKGVELWIGGRSVANLDTSSLDTSNLDTSDLPRRILVLQDLPIFEAECRRWSR